MVLRAAECGAPVARVDVKKSGSDPDHFVPDDFPLKFQARPMMLAVAISSSSRAMETLPETL